MTTRTVRTGPDPLFHMVVCSECGDEIDEEDAYYWRGCVFCPECYEPLYDDDYWPADEEDFGDET